MHRNRKTKNHTPLIVILLLLTISFFGACMFFLYKEYKKSNISGVYEGYIDLSEDCALRCYAFLSDIEDVNVSYLDVMDAYKECGISSKVVFSGEGFGKNGTYSIETDETEYKELVNECYVILGDLMKNYISVRLATEGYDYSDEECNELITSSLGCELTDYLKANFTEIFAPYENVELSYSSSGNFVMSGDELLMDNIVCDYVIDSDRLVIIKHDDEQTTNVYQKNIGSID